MISIFVFSVIIEKNSWRTGERVVKRLVKGLSSARRPGGMKQGCS